MAAIVHQRGWLDTRDVLRQVFKDDEMIRRLKTRNSIRYVDKNDLEANEASKYALLLTYGAYKLHDLKVPDTPHLIAVSVGELIAPVLPDDHFLSQANADEEITKIITYFADNETPLTRGKTKAAYIEINNNVPDTERDESWEEIPPTMLTEDFLTQHGDDYVAYLIDGGSNDMNLNGIDLFTTLFIAVAKRGNVTEDFINKISKGLEDDLQHVSKIDAETVSLVYKFYGANISATNAKIVMDRWLADIPEIALRVRLTLQQATNSGLTAFVTIGRAIKKYPDFPWPRLNQLTGGELTNFSAAVTLVNGNQYYGFNKSLGAARSTLYSSIAYVAKELLIQLNGETSLKKYAGWVRSPKNAAVIRTLMEAYKTGYVTRMEEGIVSDADQETFAAMKTLIDHDMNANIFS